MATPHLEAAGKHALIRWYECDYYLSQNVKVPVMASFSLVHLGSILRKVSRLPESYCCGSCCGPTKRCDTITKLKFAKISFSAIIDSAMR